MLAEACKGGALLRSSYRSSCPLRRCHYRGWGSTSRVTTPARQPVLVRVAAEYQSADTQDDYYSILGVAPNADVAQVKRAYRAMMREYHPDMSQDEDSTEVRCGWVAA